MPMNDGSEWPIGVKVAKLLGLLAETIGDLDFDSEELDYLGVGDCDDPIHELRHALHSLASDVPGRVTRSDSWKRLSD